MANSASEQMYKGDYQHSAHQKKNLKKKKALMRKHYWRADT
jgi:hypothetical protein